MAAGAAGCVPRTISYSMKGVLCIGAIKLIPCYPLQLGRTPRACKLMVGSEAASWCAVKHFLIMARAPFT